jgi:hypothetical protein
LHISNHCAIIGLQSRIFAGSLFHWNKEFQMKRTVFLAALLACVALVFACKSQPKSIAAQTPEEQVLKDLYDQYRSGLILDGAAKYTVVSGDTLSAIARTHYDGQGIYFPIIMLASSDVVLDPDEIKPGMVLTLPDIQKNLANARAKANMKEFFLEIAKTYDDRNRSEDAEALRELANGW